jgi:hypothetical protein
MSDIIKPVDDLHRAQDVDIELVDAVADKLSADASTNAAFAFVSDDAPEREPLRDVSSESGGQPQPSPDHAERQAAADAPKRERIAELQLEHRDLDDVIDRLADQPGVDDLRLRRLKKRKLQIRDSLERLQMSITPDIPA